MKKIVISVFLLLNVLTTYSLVKYSGNIGGYKIQMILKLYSDGVGRGAYFYDRYKTPIPLNVTTRGTSLILNNEDESIELEEYSEDSDHLTGVWRSGEKKLKIQLQKEFEFHSYDKNEFKNLELMAAESNDTEYFTFIIDKASGEDMQVTGVKVYQKNTDRLLQEIKLEAQFIGIYGISIDDYNFDGIKDFSVFEASYAGPNTSSIYLLKDRSSGKYIISNYSGSSLEFDSENKKVYSYNSSRAGHSTILNEYIVKNNELVLIKTTTREFDYDSDDFIVEVVEY